MNKFFKTTRGGTRYIILIGNLVFKFPYFKDIIKDTNELRFILKDGSTGNFGLRNGELVKLDWGGYGK